MENACRIIGKRGKTLKHARARFKMPKTAVPEFKMPDVATYPEIDICSLSSL